MRSPLLALSDIIRDSIRGSLGPEDTAYWNLSGDQEKFALFVKHSSLNRAKSIKIAAWFDLVAKI